MNTIRVKIKSQRTIPCSNVYQHENYIRHKIKLTYRYVKFFFYYHLSSCRVHIEPNVELLVNLIDIFPTSDINYIFTHHCDKTNI